jgi:uncharacterized protein (TIGR03437 family)
LGLTSPAGSEPAALQWTLTYPANSVVSISVIAAPSATNAGKVLNCIAGLGAYTCLASGLNTTAIQNGTVAIVNLTVAAGISATLIGIGNAGAAESSGSPLAVSTTGGIVTGFGSPASVNVTVNPAAQTLSAGQTLQLAATVTGGSGDTGVNWSINPNLGTISATGLYTAPASINAQQLVTVTATSVADTSESASTNIMLLPPPTVVGAVGASATFVSRDAATQGSWQGVYGANGYVVVGDHASNPGYVTPAAAGQLTYVWASSTSDVRALQKPSNPADRIAATWYNTTPFTIDLNMSDTAQHQIALYCVDWDPAGRQQTVDILDANGNVLNTQSLTTGFGGGVYLVWNVSGHVTIRVTLTAGVNAVVSGLFFDPPVAGRATLTGTALPVRRTQSATVVAGNRGPTLASRSPKTISVLACWPRVAPAGSQVSCDLRVPPSPSSLQLSLASSSGQLKVPAVVVTRPNQSNLTFQASVDPFAKQQTAIVTAALGDNRVQDSIVVVPRAGPVLTTPANLLAAWGVPVSFSVTAVDPDDLPVQLSADQLPVEASFDPASGTFIWTPNASQRGKHVITFTATNSAHESTSAETILVVDAGTPALSTPQPLNCSPNAIASVQGKWLTAGTSLSEPSGRTLELDGVTVKINNQAVPVLFSSATTVSFQCPALNPGTQLSLVLETAAGRTEALTGSMQAATPTIFSLDGSGQGQGMVSFSDMGGLAMERNYRVTAHPAQPGDELVIWATGLGWADGKPSEAVRVKIGGLNAGVESAQPVFGHAGLFAVRVQVPAAIPVGNAVPVQLELSTPGLQQASSNIVTAAFESVRQ